MAHRWANHWPYWFLSSWRLLENSSNKIIYLAFYLYKKKFLTRILWPAATRFLLRMLCRTKPPSSLSAGKLFTFFAFGLAQFRAETASVWMLLTRGVSCSVVWSKISRTWLRRRQLIRRHRSQVRKSHPTQTCREPQKVKLFRGKGTSTC